MDSSNMKANDLLKRIQDAYNKRREDPVPAGFKSLAEWSKEWGIGRTATAVACSRGVELGELKVVKLGRYDGRIIRLTNYYAPAKK